MMLKLHQQYKLVTLWNKEGKGGVFNFERLLREESARKTLKFLDRRTGSAVTWKI
jgi:hypothetical protein